MKQNQYLIRIILLILVILVGLLGIAFFLYNTIDIEKSKLSEIPDPTQIETQEVIEQERDTVTYEGLKTNTFNFEYDCQTFSLSLPLFQSIHDYFSSLDKAVYSRENTQYDLVSTYYNQFIQNEHDEEVLKLIIERISAQTSPNTTDDLATAIISFVQYIEYDCDKFFSYENKESHNYQTNFPYETLYLNQGVCGDSTILLAKILKQLGYGTAFLLFEEENHMALGIQCPNEHANYVQNGLGYCYIETTAPSRISVRPIEIANATVPNTHRIIKISNGSTFNKMNSLADQMEIDSNEYGPFILALTRCEEISQYKNIYKQEQELIAYEEELGTLNSEIEPLYKNLEYLIQQYNEKGCKGTVSKSKYKKCETERKHVVSIQYTYEALVIDYNNKVEVYNDLLNHFTEVTNSFEELISSHNSTCSGLTFGENPSDNPVNGDE